MKKWYFAGKCDKIKKNRGDTYKMEVDILIDKITDCLIDTRTEEEVETEYRMRETPIRPKDYKLNAVEITPRRMVIFEDAAQILLDKYMRK